MKDREDTEEGRWVSRSLMLAQHFKLKENGFMPLIVVVLICIITKSKNQGG